METIQPGSYVIIQRQDYSKLCKVNVGKTLALGSDRIKLDNLVSQPMYSIFKMVPIPSQKRFYDLEKVDSEKSIQDSIVIEKSGVDNKDIPSNAESQTLSTDEIQELRDKAMSSVEIVQTLVSNSKTFEKKTEFSQQKYIKKKEKKYFEYIQILKPTVRILSEMMFKQDRKSVLGIRTDDLSQIISYSDVDYSKNVLLYDSGTNGLLPAAFMNSIGAGTPGKLIYVHPGNECQKQALLALQLPEEQMNRFINVNVYSVLRHYRIKTGKWKEGEESDRTDGQSGESSKIPTETTDVPMEDVSKESSLQEENVNEAGVNNLEFGKRKCDENSIPEGAPLKVFKKPCWQINNEKAVEILENGIDSIVIAAKEHPLNVLDEFLPFLKPGQPVVIFSQYKEILVDIFSELRDRNIMRLYLLSTMLRYYQVLPERTHPEVNMTQGGYILYGYKVIRA